MNPERINKIKEVVDPVELDKLEILEIAAETTLAAYKESHKKADLNDWTAADKHLEEVVRQFEEKYFDAPPFFKNMKEALQFIQEEGYKCRRSKFYKDKDEGRIHVQPDRTILESEIYKYMQTLKKIDTGKRSSDLDGIVLKKARAELKKIETSEEKTRFQLEKERGKYILRTDVIRETTLKIAAMMAGVNHLFRIRAADWIQMVGGDASKVSMFLELTKNEVDELWNSFVDLDEIKITIQQRKEKT